MAVVRSSTILQNVEPSKRKRRRTEVETALPHRRLKELEKDEVERDRSLQGQLLTPQPKVNEAQAPRGKRRRFAVKIGKPQARANMGKSANLGIYRPASSTSEGVAKQEMHARILIGLAELILPKQTNLQRDLLSDCQ